MAVMRQADRPRWAVATAVLVVAVGLLGFGSANPVAAQAPVTLNVYISGDTNIFDLWKKALLPAFTKRYPRYKTNMVEILVADLHKDAPAHRKQLATKQESIS